MLKTIRKILFPRTRERYIREYLEGYNAARNYILNKHFDVGDKAVRVSLLSNSTSPFGDGWVACCTATNLGKIITPDETEVISWLEYRR